MTLPCAVLCVCVCVRARARACVVLCVVSCVSCRVCRAALAICDHCLWFWYFTQYYYPFSEILAFFVLIVWVRTAASSSC